MNNISESINKPRQKPIYLWLLGLIVIMVFLIYGLVSYNRWYDSHYYHTEFPVLVRLSWPVQVWERKPQVIKEVFTPVKPEEVNTPLKQYICDKFGQYQCLTAVAVAEAESGLREDAINKNSNGSYDIGIFQVNSVHWKQAGCALKDLVDAQKNVDCAAAIFKSSGNWGAWTTYVNGSYLAQLK